jgi:hypothetical protein
MTAGMLVELQKLDASLQQSDAGKSVRHLSQLETPLVSIVEMTASATGLL